MTSGLNFTVFFGDGVLYEPGDRKLDGVLVLEVYRVSLLLQRLNMLQYFVSQIYRRNVNELTAIVCSI